MLVGQIFALLIVIMIICFLGFVIYRKIQDDKLLATVTDKYRGTRSERKLALKMLKSNFDSRVIFHDLYIKRQHTGYAQIDMVIPTKVGIFVFEVKDYSGWLFGDSNHHNWTQVLGYGGYKYKFYNPIKQNESHILALRSQLQGVADVPYYSIIVFYGNCTLKNIKYVPDNTYVCYDSDVSYIVNRIIATAPVANYTDKRRVLDVLNIGKQNGADPQIRSEHLRNMH